MTSDKTIAIVGAGLIGTAIAFELAKRGASVTAFDRAQPATAASWAGAGMLAPFSEDLLDPALVELGRSSLAAYPGFVADLHARTGIDARFRPCGTLHLALDAASFAQLEVRAGVYARNGGEVTLLDRGTTLAREGAVTRALAGGVFVANEAQVDNRRLGRALVAAARNVGVRFVQTDELALETDTRRVRGLRSRHGFVPASIVVNAAGAWAGALDGVPPAARVPVFPVAGEMLALAVPQRFAAAMLRHGHVYVVPRDDGRLLVGATVHRRGFDARVTAAGLRTLLEAALLAVPALGDFAVVETWAGLRPGSPDGRPYLGATPLEGYFIAAGHYRNGILLTPMTGRILADLILTGRSEVPLTPFAVGRALPESQSCDAKFAVS